MALRIDSFGPNAMLVRFALQGDAKSFARAQALLKHFELHPIPGLVEATPGFTTLLLEFEPGTRPDPQALTATLESVVRSARSEPVPAREVDVPVVYDGPDLARVASRAGLTEQQVVELHTRPVYRVHLLGFAPGFAYLSGLNSRLHTPRLDNPRPRVPAGSVAIGGEHTGIYPIATAGGWNIIGRTELPLLDAPSHGANDTTAFRLLPGDAVRFVAAKAVL